MVLSEVGRDDCKFLLQSECPRLSRPRRRYVGSTTDALQNIVWTFTLFWYSIYDNFDCSYVFNYSYILLYNLAFTSLVVIAMGIFDQDVSDKVSLAVPQLYIRGIERKEWTQTKFW